MDEISTAANLAYADSVISDLPAAGGRPVRMSDVRALFALIEDKADDVVESLNT